MLDWGVIFSLGKKNVDSVNSPLNKLYRFICRNVSIAEAGSVWLSQSVGMLLDHVSQKQVITACFINVNVQ